MGLRILFFSNAPWCNTGYGTQTAQAWWRIQKLGHKIVAIAANYGHEGMPLNVEVNGEKAEVWPKGYSQHGNDILAMHAKAAKADIVITLYDSWIFDPRITAQFRWVPWLPIDHDPAPPQVVQALKSAWQPICYAQYGMTKLREAGLDPLYVPHGIETSIFKPGNREEALAKLGVTDCDYLAVMVAANKGAPSRKSFREVFVAFAKFVKNHPKAMLYVHSHTGVEMAGEDLEGHAQLAGIPKENLRFADQYRLIMGYPPQVLATFYQAANVLLSPSYGEGFGLPIIEAQACGCPVIVNDCSSMPELCFAGWKTTNTPFATPFMANQFRPDIESIYQCLEESYKVKSSDMLKRKAVNGAKNYDADLVAETYWKPALEKIEADIRQTTTTATSGVVFEDHAA